MDKKEKQPTIINDNKPQNIDNIKCEVMKSLLKFKEARNANGLTVAELAEKSGVSVGVISELENNDKRKDEKDKKVPSLVNFIALARTLGMSEEFVLQTVLQHGTRNSKTSRDKYLAIKNALRDYGIQDEGSITFLMQSVNFVKSRTKNKKLGN